LQFEFFHFSENGCRSKCFGKILWASWEALEALGRVLSPLDRLLGSLEALLEPPGALLGASWGLLGRSGGLPEAALEKKTQLLAKK